MNNEKPTQRSVMNYLPEGSQYYSENRPKSNKHRKRKPPKPPCKIEIRNGLTPPKPVPNIYIQNWGYNDGETITYKTAMKASKGCKPNHEFQQVIDSYNSRAVRIAAFISDTDHPLPIHEAARVFGITYGHIKRTLYRAYYETRKAA